MSNLQSQEEELEVLRSIYDGDTNFRELGPTTFQYKYGEDGHPHSFLLEISWPETYPETEPAINLDTFYNKHLKSSVKEEIKMKLVQEVEAYLGCAMTYTLMEWVREHISDLLANQPTVLDICTEASNLEISEKVDVTQNTEVRKERRVVLTKAQKRRQWDKVDAKGEKPRGWNWVDVVKHLSQTGPMQPVNS